MTTQMVNLPDNLPTLEQDSNDDNYGLEVASLQRLLVFYGYLPSDGTVLTGFFGPETDGAVRQFQKNQGLIQDGVVGADTWAALANLPDQNN